jgi:hypothetical protein
VRQICYEYVDDIIELLPGTHTIAFQFGPAPGNTLANLYAVRTDPISMEFSVEAGKRYVAQRRWKYGTPPSSSGHAGGSVNQQIYMRRDGNFDVYRTDKSAIDWWVELTDDLKHQIPFATQ